jgi:hypothetical protein
MHYLEEQRDVQLYIFILAKEKVSPTKSEVVTIVASSIKSYEK